MPGWVCLHLDAEGTEAERHPGVVVLLPDAWELPAGPDRVPLRVASPAAHRDAGQQVDPDELEIFVRLAELQAEPAGGVRIPEGQLPPDAVQETSQEPTQERASVPDEVLRKTEAPTAADPCSALLQQERRAEPEQSASKVVLTKPGRLALAASERVSQRAAPQQTQLVETEFPQEPQPLAASEPEDSEVAPLVEHLDEQVRPELAQQARSLPERRAQLPPVVPRGAGALLQQPDALLAVA